MIDLRAPDRDRQPYLHDLVAVVAAPALALSGVDGQLTGVGATGFYAGDLRVLSRLVVTVEGHAAVPISGRSTGTAAARFVGVLRRLGDPTPDPSVLLERVRTVDASGMREEIALRSRAREPVHCTVTVDLAADLNTMDAVKAGKPAERPAGPPDPPGAGAELVRTLRWPAPGGAVVLTASAAGSLEPSEAAEGTVRLSWPVTLPPRGSWSIRLDVHATGVADHPVVAPAAAPPWAPVEVRAGDHRLPALVERSLADLAGLLAGDPVAPTDRYLTAGAPWFLTLFGRDSLWAARMALPLGTEVAAGTLRTLARRQGRRTDLATAEEPGKILHEVRGAGERYYGTVDATPLWVLLLHDAWRWGLPAAEVAALLPNLEAALDWICGHEEFIRYLDRAGTGLANQGWKDSFDSVQFTDGTLAEPPIALCEVQGYAYAAARAGADLLDAFDRPGGDRRRAWADGLAERFRAAFWVTDPDGPYPAIALDGSGRPVDTVTSNIGHLLGTGLLDGPETAAVVRRLAAPDMDCGVGLRTMSARSAGFNPLGYHAGSVWPHDTAIVVRGLAATGTDAARAAATGLIRGLLTAGAAFDHRLPELYGGETAEPGREPLPYPAACRPQAWSAGAALVALSALLGLEPDVPAGRLTLRPLRPCPVDGLTVRGLRIAGAALDLRVDATGAIEVRTAPPDLTVTVVD